MRRVLATVAGVVLLAQSLASAQTIVSSLTIPVPAGDLAAAAGLDRTDPSTLGLDLVRILFASPRAPEAIRPRAAVTRLLDSGSAGTDRIPLPLTQAIWRERLLGANVADGKLAAAILTQRVPALIYHALMGMDDATRQWLVEHPRTLEHFNKFPGAAAVFARSIHVRNGMVVTPGERADDVWAALVGVSPSNVDGFVGRLLSGRDGRLAYLYDTVAHLDPPHQRLALPPAASDARIGRARALLDAAADSAPTWKIEDRPFLRPDVDASLLLRLIRVDDTGAIAGIPSRRSWSRAFGEGDGGPEDAAIDAAWLTARIVHQPATIARERLDMYLLAQRVISDQRGHGSTDKNGSPHVVEALRGLARYPALALTLERCGVTGIDAYAAASRFAGAIVRSLDELLLAQSLLAIVDTAHRAGSVATPRAVELATSLLDTNGDGRDVAPRLVDWFRSRLIPALRSDLSAPTDLDVESLLIRAVAGPSPATPPVVEWEGRRYAVDVGAAERARIGRIRKRQPETPVDRALSAATTTAGVRTLGESLSALVYAVAIGDPDGPAIEGGAVWRRHRFTPDAAGASTDTAWRLATESFGPGGWRLTGSLLALDAAMPRLALRRLDATSMPPAGRISTSDRHALLLSVALMQPAGMTGDNQHAIAQAVAKGHERLRALTPGTDQVMTIAHDAGISEWRTNALAWTLKNDQPRADTALTLVELYRLGQSEEMPDAWGSAAEPTDGSLTLRFPRGAWEDYAGRAGTGVLGSQLADAGVRTALALDSLHLPAAIGRHVMAFAMQDVVDRTQPAYFDDFLSLAFTARTLESDRFEDYVAALTAAGPLVPVTTQRREP